MTTFIPHFEASAGPQEHSDTDFCFHEPPVPSHIEWPPFLPDTPRGVDYTLVCALIFQLVVP